MNGNLPQRRDAHLAHAHDLFSAALYALATAELEPALDADQSGEALCLQARTLLRLRRPTDVVQLLTERRRSLASDTFHFYEATLLLATAHGQTNDAETARALFESTPATFGEDGDEALDYGSERAYTEAFLAYLANAPAEKLSNLERKLSRFAQCQPGPVMRARLLDLKAWFAARREDYRAHIEDLTAALDALRSSERGQRDVGLQAGVLRGLAAIVREIAAPALRDRVDATLDAMPWSADINIARFQATRTIGWAHALAGDYLRAFKRLHEATEFAPSPAWKMMSYLDRAYFRRASNDFVRFKQELTEVEALLLNIPWALTNEEERFGLIVAAELFAPMNVSRAASLLATFRSVGSSLSPVLVLANDERLNAFVAFTSGVVSAAQDLPEAAAEQFKAAFRVFDRIGYQWRAALCALHLYRTTLETAWLDLARARIADYPQSWIAQDVAIAQRAPVPTTVAGDADFARLTARQRDVFRLLVDGHRAAAIAAVLGVKMNTVRVHRDAVFRAFDVHSQVELLAEARKRRLI